MHDDQPVAVDGREQVEAGRGGAGGGLEGVEDVVTLQVGRDVADRNRDARGGAPPQRRGPGAQELVGLAAQEGVDDE